MLSFGYTMEIDFEGGSAREHAFTLRCLPQETPSQHISAFEMRMDPSVPVSYGIDGFGNRYCYGVIRDNHSRFLVDVAGMATRYPDRHECVTAAQQMLFRQPSVRTEPGPALHRMLGLMRDGVPDRYGGCGRSRDAVIYDKDRQNRNSSGCFDPDHQKNGVAFPMEQNGVDSPKEQNGMDLPREQNGITFLREKNEMDFPAMKTAAQDSREGDYALACRIRDLVHASMTYVPGATDPATTAEEAAARGKGVCQDYAQVMLALCRMCGIPCRYAAGLFLGEGASHAWVEVCDGGIWRELDPTNPAAGCSARLLFSHGRDAGDCEINRGVYLGPGQQLQRVKAVVLERG